jgi:hypothetical protein
MPYPYGLFVPAFPLPALQSTTKPRPKWTGFCCQLEFPFLRRRSTLQRIRAAPPAPLRLGDLAALDAACADPDPLRLAVYQRLDSLQVHIPPPPGDVVGVRNIVTVLRAFPADVAYLCHDFAPNFGLSRRRHKTSGRFHFRSAPCRIAERRRPTGQMQTHATDGLPNLHYTRNRPLGQPGSLSAQDQPEISAPAKANQRAFSGVSSIFLPFWRFCDCSHGFYFSLRLTLGIRLSIYYYRYDRLPGWNLYRDSTGKLETAASIRRFQLTTCLSTIHKEGKRGKHDKLRDVSGGK